MLLLLLFSLTLLPRFFPQETGGKESYEPAPDWLSVGGCYLDLDSIRLSAAAAVHYGLLGRRR